MNSWFFRCLAASSPRRARSIFRSRCCKLLMCWTAFSSNSCHLYSQWRGESFCSAQREIMLTRAQIAVWAETVVFGGGTQAQFVRFCAIGIGSGVLDFCTYRTALYLAVATVPAKALGYIAGTS